LLGLAVVNAALLWSIIVPITAMAAATVVVAGLYYVRGRRSSSTSGQEVPLINPFSLTAAIKFALFFTVVQLIVKLAQKYLPAQSFYAVAALAGLSEVDAITLSMAEYARERDPHIATASIVIAAITNTLVTCSLVFLLGGRSLALRIAIATGILLLTGAVTLFDPPLSPIKAPPTSDQSATKSIDCNPKSKIENPKSRLLHHLQQLDIKNQRRKRRNRTARRPLWPVGQIRRNVEPPFVARFHFLQCFGPA
jgi:hypothetical protein